MNLKTFISILIFILLKLYCVGQSKDVKPDIYDLPIPKNLSQCFQELDRTFDDTKIKLVKTLPEDSIYFNKEFQSGDDFFHAWKIYEGSRLTKHFNSLGLYGSFEIYEAILISYHRYLNHQAINLSDQIKKYQKKQKADRDYYLAKLNKDTLNGVYIPKDITESLSELDKLLDKKTKDLFINKDEDKVIASVYRFNPGLWIRNNWGLWGGSRLQKYFNDLGVKDPEAMSVLILTCYYRKTNNLPLKFTELVKTNSSKK